MQVSDSTGPKDDCEVSRLFAALQPDSDKPFGYSIHTPKQQASANETPEHALDSSSGDDEDIGDWSLGRSFRPTSEPRESEDRLYEEIVRLNASRNADSSPALAVDAIGVVATSASEDAFALSNNHMHGGRSPEALQSSHSSTNRLIGVRKDAQEDGQGVRGNASESQIMQPERPFEWSKLQDIGFMPGEWGWARRGEHSRTIKQSFPEHDKQRPIGLRKRVLSESLYGIGILLALNESGVPAVVREVSGERPAQEKRIKEGDILLAINGVSVAHQHPKCLLEKLLWGRQGSDVQLTLQEKDSAAKYLAVCSRRVHIKSWQRSQVSYYLLDNQEAEFGVGASVIEHLNTIRHLVADDGAYQDWLLPMEEWQYARQFHTAVMTACGDARPAKKHTPGMSMGDGLDSLAYHIRLDCIPRESSDSTGQAETAPPGTPSSLRENASREGRAGADAQLGRKTAMGITFEFEIARPKRQESGEAREWWSHVTSMVSPLLGLGESLTPSAGRGRGDCGEAGSASTDSAQAPAVVHSVLPGGPADICRLMKGDLVVSVEGHRAHAGNVASLLQGADRLGSSASLVIQRDGVQMEASIIRTAAGHIRRIEEVVALLDLLADLSSVQEDTVSVSKSVDPSPAAAAAKIEGILDQETVSGSGWGGRARGLGTDAALLAELRWKILGYFRWSQASDHHHHLHLSGIQGNILEELDSIAAGIRVLPAASPRPTPPPADYSQQCDALQQKLSETEEMLAKCRETAVDNQERAHDADTLVAGMQQAADLQRVKILKHLQGRSARAARARALAGWRQRWRDRRWAHQWCRGLRAKRGRASQAARFRQWLAATTHCIRQRRREGKCSAARVRALLLGVVGLWSEEAAKSRNDVEARQSEQNRAEKQAAALETLEEKHALALQALAEEHSRAMLKSAEEHAAAIEKHNNLRICERDHWAAEREQVLQEHDKQLQVAAAVHDVKLGQARTELKLLEQYLLELQEDHKILCDNKNLVSHQLGLPAQGDGGAVARLREEVRQITADNRSLKEKLEEKQGEIRLHKAKHAEQARAIENALHDKMKPLPSSEAAALTSSEAGWQRIGGLGALRGGVSSKKPILIDSTAAPDTKLQTPYTKPAGEDGTASSARGRGGTAQRGLKGKGRGEAGTASSVKMELERQADKDRARAAAQIYHQRHRRAPA